MTKKYTIKQAKAIVKELGGTLTWLAEWSDFRVRFGADNEYFTDDIEDAVDTARCMAKEKQG